MTEFLGSMIKRLLAFAALAFGCSADINPTDEINQAQATDRPPCVTQEQCGDAGACVHEADEPDAGGRCFLRCQVLEDCPWSEWCRNIIELDGGACAPWGTL